MQTNQETTTTSGTTAPTTAKVSPTAKNTLLILSCILLSIGNCGGPLITRLYFIHGGNRVWLSSSLETAGWPVILPVLVILYFIRRSTNENNKTTTFIHMRPRLFFAVAFIGVITGLDDYLYAYGVARLPISTSALILTPHLAFLAFFAYLLVKQKFTAYSVNAVVLLTVGAGVLALHTDGDRPNGESKKEYVMGFVMTVLAALLYGFVLPLVELTYNKAKQEITYTLVLEVQIVMCLFATLFCVIGMTANNDFKYVMGFVMTVLAALLYGFMLPLIELTYNKAKQEITYTLVLEVQIVMCLFATLFCVVGMTANNDFKVIPRESKDFELGQTKYYAILCASALIWQCFFLGAIGVIFCASSLLSGIIIAVLLPITEVLAVIFYKEKFQAEKGVALILSLWGFTSYFYGEYKFTRNSKDGMQSSQQQMEIANTNYSSV